MALTVSLKAPKISSRNAQLLVISADFPFVPLLWNFSDGTSAEFTH
ncbi:hypothetical protein PXNS11_230158 [Stutzerimonas xanthomarina]|nr:hypothetical protein PXNS11_230158 [Stutzerimonas xanthomarina]